MSVNTNNPIVANALAANAARKKYFKKYKDVVGASIRSCVTKLTLARDDIEKATSSIAQEASADHEPGQSFYIKASGEEISKTIYGIMRNLSVIASKPLIDEAGY